jgi:DNA helicase-2/ATP-dependent DNA helicase PcrA
VQPESVVEQPSLAGFLEQVALVADADEIPSSDPDEHDRTGMVTLMTLHTAKGLEFPVVFLTGLVVGVFPHLRSLGDSKALEEERRLAYVGITRARQRLYLSRAVTRSAWGQPQVNPESRFIEELPGDVVRWERTDGAYTSWSGGAGVGGRGSFGRRGGERRATYAGPAGRGSDSGATDETSTFRGGTPRAVELARRLGVDASKLATASDLPRARVPALEAGDRVSHDRHGVGRVLIVSGEGNRAQAQIDFGDQVLWVVLRHAPIEKL